MIIRVVSAVVLTGVVIGCAGERWPDPPAVESSAYEAEHDAWRDEQRGMLAGVLPIVGIWPLPDGETAFGAEASLPIVLPSTDVPDRAGVFRRTGMTITVIPAPGAPLTLEDGTPISDPQEAGTVIAGSIRLEVAAADDDRRWVMAMDQNHPAVQDPPAVETYPLDPRWRVAARLDAFATPKPVRVADVRGGFMDFVAPGELVFRLDDQEMRLTALGFPGEDRFFVMFKDPTNATTTYSGYRILTPEVVGAGEWTVIDFNFASNPPCAYSRYTVCPLPPPENRLPVAIEAGLKRLPSAQGFTP
jgi:uncharacterized protein (DUF1684 family)